MTDLLATKTSLRAFGLSQRAAMSESERAEASARAISRIRPLVAAGEIVSLFWPMRGEIDPRDLIQHVRSKDGRIAMPVLEKRRMFFRLFDDESDLEAGVFGTRHPHAGKPVVDPDLIVAPLAAFDRTGGRIGYGAGHYDKAIAELMARKRPFRVVGIAFACQEVEQVPLESHDVRLPLIATERELIRAEAVA
jgi:5-formyltetrahydrofolate cyclo-ligase